MLAPVTILNLKPKETTKATAVDLDVPEFTSDDEKRDYCVRCFTDCMHRLKDQNSVQVTGLYHRGSAVFDSVEL